MFGKYVIETKERSGWGSILCCCIIWEISTGETVYTTTEYTNTTDARKEAVTWCCEQFLKFLEESTNIPREQFIKQLEDKEYRHYAAEKIAKLSGMYTLENIIASL